MTPQEWNKSFPIGTKVWYISSSKKVEETFMTTRSKAIRAPNGESVIQLDGVSDYVPLSHLKVFRRKVMD